MVTSIPSFLHPDRRMYDQHVITSACDATSRCGSCGKWTHSETDWVVRKLPTLQHSVAPNVGIPLAYLFPVPRAGESKRRWRAELTRG